MKDFETTPGVSSGQETTHCQETELANVIGFDALDMQGNSLGRVEAIWTDHTGEAAYLGVKSGWFMGKTHVVPAFAAEVSYPREHVRIPYTKDDVKNAPCYDPDDQLTLEREQEISSYYRSRGPSLPDAEQTEFEEPSSESSQSETTIPLHEEELKVGKRQVEAGGVRLRKVIRTETVQAPVELRREDIVVERVPASEAQVGSNDSTQRGAFESEEIYIPLRREEAVVQKDVRVREQLRARKTEQVQRENVSGEVRREEVEVEDTRRDEPVVQHRHD